MDNQGEVGGSRACEECSGRYTVRQLTQKYCSKKCGKIAGKKARGDYVERRELLCGFCGVKIITGFRHKKFCSRKCAQNSYNQQWRGVNVTDRKLSTGTTGAIAEYVVAVDLLFLGYDVYRAMSPACPCDLAVGFAL